MKAKYHLMSSLLPKTPLRLCWELTTGVLVPHTLWHSKKFRLKFALRSIVMPFSTHNMLKALIHHPCYKTLLLKQPRLPCRLHRPYLSSKWKRSKGVQAISYHYQTIYSLLGLSNFETHLHEGLVITRLSGKGNENYILRFISTFALDREGESSIILESPDNKMLCKLTFTLYEVNNQRHLLIGGLQGLKHIDANALTQAATKDLYGVFPKKIVYEALVAIARVINVDTIKSVSNKTHVYQALRYNDKKQYLHANYNSSWEMLGGILDQEGYFDLPSFSGRKDITEIPSKKRSEYRKRYELLDDIKNKSEFFMMQHTDKKYIVY